MAAVRLLNSLPAPKRHVEPIAPVQFFGKDTLRDPSTSRIREPPPYGQRQGFVPRKVEDFGDGGAFPEIQVAQYPLDMGRKDAKPSANTLPLNVDADGNIAYDAVAKLGDNAARIVYTQHRDLVPKVQDTTDEELARPDEEASRETTERTRLALEKVVNRKIAAAQPSQVPGKPGAPTYIKYAPSQSGGAFNSGARERVIRMVEMPQDPLEPPKFKHKRVPKAAGSAPDPPVMHSPPRAVTVKDQQDWKIPPCISNWKNAKGYTIPLDKRLAADGRGLQEVQINDNFAKLSESLYVAEQKAREAIEMRSKIQRELALKEKEKKEQELRLLAQRARLERAGHVAPGGAALHAERPAAGGDGEGAAGETREERDDRMRRDAIREERRRERERERRLEAKEGHKKSKTTRDRDRDVSEKIALGQANVGGAAEVQYDQRLFNQEEGMASGFGAEDQYNVYDKGLFASERPSAGGLYRPKRGADDETYGEDQLDKITKTDRFRADKGFAGAAETGPRSGPVEFEKNPEEADPFGLDQFLSDIRKGKKALDKIGSGGTMRASGGSGSRDMYDGGSGRSRVDFERSGK